MAKTKGTLKYRKVQRTPQSGDNAGKTWSNKALRELCNVEAMGTYGSAEGEGTEGGGSTSPTQPGGGGSGNPGGGEDENVDL